MKIWTVCRLAMVASVCFTVFVAGSGAHAQRLDTAPAVTGSGCAQAAEAWKSLSSSNSVEALKGYRSGLPKTCPDQLAAASARIAKLEAAAEADRRRQQATAVAESKRVLDAKKKVKAERRAVLETIRNNRWYLQPMNKTWTCTELLSGGYYKTYAGDDEILVSTSHSIIEGKPRFAGPFRESIVSFQGNAFVGDDGTRRTTYHLLSTSQLVVKWDDTVAYLQAC